MSKIMKTQKADEDLLRELQICENNCQVCRHNQEFLKHDYCESCSNHSLMNELNLIMYGESDG